MSMRKIALALAMTGGLMFASAAQSAVLKIDFAGFKNGSRTGDVKLDLGGGAVFEDTLAAGQFVFDVDFDVDNVSGTPEIDIFTQIVAFCTEVDIDLDTPANYELLAAAAYFTPAKLTLIEQLFGLGLGSIGDADNDAAFQLALWEIIYDTDATLSSGVFQATGFGAALGIAQGWLDALGTGGTFTQLWALRANGEYGDPSQDLITWVPEPGTLALIGAGLIGFGALRRRKAG